MLTEGSTIMARCVKGLPEGARFVGLQYEAYGDIWLLVWEHESFYPVQEGEMLHRLTIEYVSILPPDDLSLAGAA
jgi:hypothetical protein